eukprot:scaffold53381_cov15-Tisochrysis_lutea.AAC.1
MHRLTRKFGSTTTRRRLLGFQSAYNYAYRYDHGVLTYYHHLQLLHQLNSLGKAREEPKDPLLAIYTFNAKGLATHNVAVSACPKHARAINCHPAN